MFWCVFLTFDLTFDLDIFSAEESYELVGEAEHIDKDVDDEDMNQDNIEMEATEMDMSKMRYYAVYSWATSN